MKKTSLPEDAGVPAGHGHRRALPALARVPAGERGDGEDDAGEHADAVAEPEEAPVASSPVPRCLDRCIPCARQYRWRDGRRHGTLHSLPCRSRTKRRRSIPSASSTPTGWHRARRRARIEPSPAHAGPACASGSPCSCSWSPPAASGTASGGDAAAVRRLMPLPLGDGGRVLCIGHRGAPAWLPRTRSPRSAAAVAAGVDLVELDVDALADGRSSWPTPSIWPRSAAVRGRRVAAREFARCGVSRPTCRPSTRRSRSSPTEAQCGRRPARSQGRRATPRSIAGAWSRRARAGTVVSSTDAAALRDVAAAGARARGRAHVPARPARRLPTAARWPRSSPAGSARPAPRAPCGSRLRAAGPAPTRRSSTTGVVTAGARLAPARPAGSPSSPGRSTTRTRSRVSSRQASTASSRMIPQCSWLHCPREAVRLRCRPDRRCCAGAVRSVLLAAGPAGADGGGRPSRPSTTTLRGAARRRPRPAPRHDGPTTAPVARRPHRSRSPRSRRRSCKAEARREADRSP